MCLWVAAPQRKLKYIYCSERIVPRANGGLTVVADMLLQNMSASEYLDQLALIYPHAFPLVPARTQGRDQCELKGEFRDCSVTLRDPRNPDNRLYIASGRLTPIPAARSGDHDALRITIPDANYPDRVADYEGTLPGNNKIIPGWDEIPTGNRVGDNHWYVLTFIDYSLWTCRLCTPMAPKEQRWFRWEITSPPSKFNERALLVRVFQRLAGRRRFDYTIHGPLNVRDTLFAKLHTLRAFPETDPEIVGDCTQLIDLLNDLGISDDEYAPEAMDWRTNLSPGLFPRVENLTQEGIRVAGHQPNTLSYEHIQNVPQLPLRERLYQWKTGSVHGLKEARFSISFDWVLESSWRPLLPWVAIGISTAALILQIWK